MHSRGTMLGGSMSIQVTFKDGVFEPLEDVMGLRPGQTCTVFSDEELDDIRGALGWLRSLKRAASSGTARLMPGISDLHRRFSTSCVSVGEPGGSDHSRVGLTDSRNRRLVAQQPAGSARPVSRRARGVFRRHQSRAADRPTLSALAYPAHA